MLWLFLILFPLILSANPPEKNKAESEEFKLPVAHNALLNWTGIKEYYAKNA